MSKRGKKERALIIFLVYTPFFLGAVIVGAIFDISEQMYYLTIGFIYFVFGGIIGAIIWGLGFFDKWRAQNFIPELNNENPKN